MTSTHSPTFKIDGEFTLDTAIGEICIDPGSHDEPPAYEPYTIRDMLAGRLASQLLEELKRDSTGHRAMIDKVRSEVDSQIAEAVAPMVAEAVAKPIQKTNDYGAPRGEPLTLQEIIMEQIGKALLAGGDRYKKSPMAKAIEATTEKAVKRELDAELTEARKEIRQRMREASSAVFADVLASAAGV